MAQIQLARKGRRQSQESPVARTLLRGVKVRHQEKF